MDSSTGTAFVSLYARTHLDHTEVECPTCEAAPGEECTSLHYGNGYLVPAGHDGRHEAAGWHELETVTVDDQQVTRCRECGHVEDVN